MPEGVLAVGAHTSPFTGQGVTVAILDTGVDDTHPVFQGKTLVKKDFTGEGVNDQDVTDTVGHGTHCAATICAAPLNGVRVGVRPASWLSRRRSGRNGGPEMLLKGLSQAVLMKGECGVDVLGWACWEHQAVDRERWTCSPAQAAMRQQGHHQGHRRTRSLP
jgi:hypothetical protein